MSDEPFTNSLAAIRDNKAGEAELARMANNYTLKLHHDLVNAQIQGTLKQRRKAVPHDRQPLMNCV